MSENVVGARELSAKLQRLARRVSGPERMQALMAGGQVIEAAAKANVRAQKLIDTGNLRGSITAEPDGQDAVSIGPRGVIYAAIHEFGGTIRPKSAKFLAVPLTAGARAAESPRAFGSALHFVGTDAGGVLIDGAGDAQYALVGSVTLPAKPYLRPALDEHGAQALGAIENALWSILESEAE